MIMDKEWIIEGNVWKVGDNVNTESIMPSRWLHEGPEAVMEHIGELLIPDFPRKCKEGDIWVGGVNLGCSSSRNAASFLRKKGIGAIVCASASRIFFRNAVNSGLPIFDIGEQVDRILLGDRLRIDVRGALIKNVTRNDEIQAKKFPDFLLEILEAGGIDDYVSSRRSEYDLLE